MLDRKHFPLAIASTALLLLAAGELPELKIGDAMPMPDHALTDMNGGKVTLSSIGGQNGTLVIFSCNTCPFVIGSQGSEGWEGRYNELGVVARELGIGMVLVNSNEAKREAGDGLQDMVARNKQQRFTAAYVMDANSVLADAFGARTTPHVFLFNKDQKLAYMGAIDDNVKSATSVGAHWLRDAMHNMVSGKEIDPATTRNIGCSIKRVSVSR